MRAKQNGKRRGLRGFTLAEVMIAVFVTTLLMAGLGQTFILMQKNFLSLGNYVDFSANARKTLELFGRDMRMTATVYTATSTEVDVDIMTPTGTQGVNYTYDPVADTFSRTVGGQTTVLLKDCAALRLTYYTITDSVTTSLGSIKKVQLDAITRRFVQNIENTDMIITATYMMRNRAVAN